MYLTWHVASCRAASDVLSSTSSRSSSPLAERSWRRPVEFEVSAASVETAVVLVSLFPERTYGCKRKTGHTHKHTTRTTTQTVEFEVSAARVETAVVLVSLLPERT